MTENEAIKIVTHCLGVQAEQEVCEECPVYRESGIVCKEIARTAITALKEIQQYREMDKKLREAYGDCDGLLAIAVEGLCKHPGINIGEPIKARLLIDEDVDKWDAYREIGTVEECREAVEKQKPKTPDYEGDGYADGYMVYDTWICPNCGAKYEVDYDDYKYCPECGQAIAENLEGREDE